MSTNFKRLLSRSVSTAPLGKAIKIRDLVKLYLSSARYKSLSQKSKDIYLSKFKVLDEFKMPDSRSLLDGYAHRVDYFITDSIKTILLVKYTPATVASFFSVLGSVWELGIKIGYLYANPWYKAGIKINNLRDIVWTTQDREKAMKCAEERGYDILRLYILLAYSTAQRPFSDLRNLKWENFVKEGNRYVFDFVISKTQTHIILPLDKYTSDTLLAFPRTSEYIFADKRGKRLSISGITRQLNAVKKLCGLDDRLTMRDLRRTAVTELAQAGATVSEITAITGWKVPEKVLNRYALVRLSTADNALAKRTAFQNANSISESNDVLSEPKPSEEHTQES